MARAPPSASLAAHQSRPRALQAGSTSRAFLLQPTQPTLKVTHLKAAFSVSPTTPGTWHVVRCPPARRENFGKLKSQSEAELPAKRTSSKDKDAKLVESTISWLKNDLENLSQSFPSLALDIEPPVPGDEGHTYAEYFWICAEQLQGASQTTIWSLRFLAACCSLVGAAFTLPAASVSSSQVRPFFAVFTRVGRDTDENYIVCL
jgi:hypothetical protein